MEFTTQKRREMTSSILEQENMISQTEKFSDNINSAYGQKVKEDKTNREMFLTINSQLTGLAYEYMIMTGYYHPMLEEQRYTYTQANDDMTEFTEGEYWDSPKLQKAANLEEGNEFHLNIREDTSTFYPERPLKYSRWVNDLHSEVSTFSPTEQDLFNAIRSLHNWYNSGGTSGSTEVTIFGEFKSFIPDTPDTEQPYMTVGYTEYKAGQGGFMSDGYNPDGDLILINPTDNQNFSFGKIISSKSSPSRILYAPFCSIGVIPDNAVITSTYTSGNGIYIKVILRVIDRLNEFYNNLSRYLENNPNVEDNRLVLENVNEVKNKIMVWNSTQDMNVLLDLVNEIESLRTGMYISRTSYINTFLSNANELYEDRFEILDMRLSKRMGTLREMMKYQDRIGELFRIKDEKKGQVGWFKKYFIVKKCERDGDWKRRVFIVDPEGDIEVGDEVYLLTDNEEIPEMKATVDIIVEARLEDLLSSSVNEDTGEVLKEYYPVKKIFFRDAIIDDKIKPKRFFPNTYRADEGFRLIKQIGE